jgi:hypothetical protein
MVINRIAERSQGMIYIGLMDLIETGGIAMLLILGGGVGGAVAAFVDVFSKRTSRAR